MLKNRLKTNSRFFLFGNQLIFIKKSVIIIEYTKTVGLNRKDETVSEDI